jgi:hypothetical protein
MFVTPVFVVQLEAWTLLTAHGVNTKRCRVLTAVKERALLRCDTSYFWILIHYFGFSARFANSYIFQDVLG